MLNTRCLREGCRGHLGKQLISQFHLDEGKNPQHYAIGIKEIWQIAPEKHEQGKVIHGLGWPLAVKVDPRGAHLCTTPKIMRCTLA